MNPLVLAYYKYRLVTKSTYILGSLQDFRCFFCFRHTTRFLMRNFVGWQNEESFCQPKKFLKKHGFQQSLKDFKCFKTNAKSVILQYILFVHGEKSCKSMYQLCNTKVLNFVLNRDQIKGTNIVFFLLWDKTVGEQVGNFSASIGIEEKICLAGHLLWRCYLLGVRTLQPWTS